MFDFTDKVVVITGAAGNLGRAATHAFHTAGACTAAVDRQRSSVADAFASSIPESDTCLYLAADLMDADSVAHMAQTVVGTFGRVDALLNIAGGFTMGTPLHETPLKTWDFMLNLNARSVYFTCSAIVPQMLTQGSGKIVNIAARAALQGKANMGAYIASKAAVMRLTETMSEELKASGINVNCILPGTIDTPRNREDMPKADFSKWVSPEAIADAILFLCSDAARAVHGAALPVYGLG